MTDSNTIRVVVTGYDMSLGTHRWPTNPHNLRKAVRFATNLRLRAATMAKLRDEPDQSRVTVHIGGKRLYEWDEFTALLSTNDAAILCSGLKSRIIKESDHDYYPRANG